MSSAVGQISRRPLHYVFKIGNRKANLEFFRDILGMKVLRHEEFAEGCKAACNGPYDGKWSKTMIGYGKEDDHFVMELTYNYNIGSYKVGNDFGGLTIFSKTIRNQAAKMSYQFQEQDGGFLLKSPDGYKFFIIEEESDKDPVKRVTFHASNIKRSTDFWNRIAGLSIHNQSDKKTELTAGNNHCNLEIAEISEPIDRASGYGRIAFAVPHEELPGIEKLMTDNKETVLTPLLKLDTPGKATVEVVICADPDGHEICFVGDEAFRELSRIDETSNAALEKAIESDKSDEWFSKKGKVKVEGLEMEYPGGKKQHFRHLLFFAFHQGQNATEAARDICKVYGEGVIGESTARKWFAKFKNGDFDVDDTPRKGRPSKLDEERLKSLLKEDSHQTSRELAVKMNCDHKTILNHLHSMGFLFK